VPLGTVHEGEPSSLHFGVRWGYIKPRGTRSEDGRREIRSGVLRFPDQHLGLGDLKRFSGQFGKIRSDAETSVADRSIVCC